MTVAISLFLGAGTAWSIIYPFAREQYRPDFGVRLERVGANANAFILAVDNRGRRAAFVKYIDIFFGKRHQFLAIKDGGNVIKAKETHFLQLVFPKDVKQPVSPVDYSVREPSGKVHQVCELLVSVYAGEERLIKVNDFQSNCLGDFNDFITGQQSVG